MNEINPEWIQNRINNFFGYGNLDSPIWLIGMEDGFTGTPEELALRFELTQNGPVIDIEDGMIHEDGRRVEDHLQWYVPSQERLNWVELQKTFKNLIRLILAYEGQSVPNNPQTTELIRQYQMNSFGRFNSNNAVIELMPLPCKGIDDEHWNYNVPNLVNHIPALNSRDAFLCAYKEKRKEQINNLIVNHNPNVIICYSFEYKQDWLDIFGGENLTNQAGDQTYYQHYINKGRHLFIVTQPTSRHYQANAIWVDIANAIQNRNN